MLRSLFVVAILAYGCAKSLKGPFYALLFYLWLAYFRPEAWLWTDFITQLDLSLLLGLVVLFSMLLSGEKIRFSVGSLLMLVFLTHSLISTLVSPYFDYSWPLWVQFAKQVVISLVIVTLVNTEERLRLTLGVIAVSVGFEAVKQGWASLILHPGSPNENPHPVFGDNNGVAVGMLMLVAILIALARVSPKRWQRLLSRFAAVGVVYRGLSTYSRGGFLSCGILALHFLVRSKRKVVGMLAIAAVSIAIIPVLPATFWARMNTINDAIETRNGTDDVDSSVQGRLHFWKIAVAMADERPFVGVGHQAFQRAYRNYDTSAGEFGEIRAAHSSWFGVLADLGFPGLALFILLIANGFRTCIRAQRLARRDPALQDLGRMAMAIEGALLVYCVGGSFVSDQYLEMHWHMLALSVVVDRLVRERVTVVAQVPAAHPTLQPARALLGGRIAVPGVQFPVKS
jgi:probable O-glycosylation ligase (exosortase A-associated)